MLKLGIYPEKLYRATFIRQYGLCCCNMASFLFDSFVKIWDTCENFLGKWFTAPPWQKISRTPMLTSKVILFKDDST